jgi:hypothetical protein
MNVGNSSSRPAEMEAGDMETASPRGPRREREKVATPPHLSELLLRTMLLMPEAATPEAAPMEVPMSETSPACPPRYVVVSAVSWRLKEHEVSCAHSTGHARVHTVPIFASLRLPIITHPRPGRDSIRLASCVLYIYAHTLCGPFVAPQCTQIRSVQAGAEGQGRAARTPFSYEP